MSFPETRWTMIRQAIDEPSVQSRAAMASLCEAYAEPVLAFIQRRVGSPEQAEDVAQDFFARLIEGHLLRRADPEIGRFRTFLLHALRCFISDARDHANTLKRGGNVPKVSLSADAIQPMHELTPEAEFDRRWVRAILRRAIGRLEEEYRDGARRELFLELRDHLDSGSKPETQEIAWKLKMTDAAVRVSLHRMRVRLGKLIRHEIAETLPASANVDDEIRNLKEFLEKSR